MIFIAYPLLQIAMGPAYMYWLKTLPRGAGKMVIDTGDHPALLKDAVTTPAGCTVDGILKLEEGGLRVTLIKTVVEAARRARELVE